MENSISKQIEILLKEGRKIAEFNKNWLSKHQLKIIKFWLSIIDKTINLLDWVSYAIEKKNVYVAYSLLRSILDLLMYITFILYIDQKPKKYQYLDLYEMFDDFSKKWRIYVKIKNDNNREKNILKESFLIEKCQNVFFKKDWHNLEKIYNSLSRFVHFSNKWSEIIIDYDSIKETWKNIEFWIFCWVWNKNRNDQNEYLSLLNYTLKCIIQTIQKNNQIEK